MSLRLEWCTASQLFAEVIEPHEPAWDGQSDEEHTLCLGVDGGIAIIGDLDEIERALVRALVAVGNAR